MDELKFTFKGTNDKIYNDVGYPHPPFDLINNSYNFIVNPKSEFWRFGIILSESENADFFSNNRYNKKLRYIEVDVGERKSELWSFSNRLFLQEYYIIKEGEGSVLKAWDTYKSASEVNLTVSYDIDKQAVIVSCMAEGCALYTIELSLANYKYFNIAAWADERDFEIDCLIRSFPNSKPQIQEEHSSRENRVKELWANIQNFGAPVDKFKIQATTDDSITVQLDGTFFNFYINLQKNKEYFTIRRSPEPKDNSYILHDIDSWKNVLNHFLVWLDDIKSNFTPSEGGGQKATTVNMQSHENVYKISMGDFDASEIEDCIKAHKILVHGETKPKGQSYEAQSDTFKNAIKRGDYFYLTHGNGYNRMKFFGRIVGDAVSSIYKNYGAEGWLERSIEIIQPSLHKEPYSGTNKWWAPNNNSTCIQIPKDEIQEANKLIFSPYFHLALEFSVEPDGIENLSISTASIPENQQSYLPHLESEGNHTIKQDQLEFRNDIESFANVISLKSVIPPLAIGLFGNWGSGKSFFMHKLSNRIDEITSSKDPQNVQNVVQVKFNSWHYSDSNLWASLITEIFDQLKIYATGTNQSNELDKLTEKLHITHSEKVEAELRTKELEKSIDILEKEKNQKRKRLQDISGLKLLEIIIKNNHVRQDLAGLNNENIESIVKDKNKIDVYINQVKTVKEEFVWSLRFLKESRGRQIFLIFTLLSVFAITFIIQRYFLPEWQKYTYLISIALSACVTVTSAFFKYIRPFTNGLNEVYRRLKSIKQDLDNRQDKIPDQLRSEIQELVSLKEKIEILDKNISDTRVQITDIKSGKKLIQFIEERSRDENYARKLGLISWIRKDFKKLDDLLRKQFEASKIGDPLIDSSEVNLRIDRIILYIDDLDRCKAEIVVKVLEAIHLLLAFPIFVVIVGVDPRWLDNALKETYSELLDSPQAENDVSRINNNCGGPSANNSATTYDYLEKIFQITFSIKPVYQAGRERLIEYLFKDEMESLVEIPPSHNGPERVSKDEQENLLNHQQGSDDSQGKEPFKVPVPQILENTTIENQTESVNRSIRLTISKHELEFMKRISPLFGHTPRIINRFVNVYRIVKSHKSLIISSEDKIDIYKPIMFLLGVIIGQAPYASWLIENLHKYNGDVTMGKFMLDSNFPIEIDSLISSDVRKEMSELRLNLFTQNIHLISRFSFRMQARLD